MNSQPLRLSIVMPSFFEQAVGGSEYQAYLLSAAAKEAGIEVHYVFVDNGCPCPNNLNIQLHPLKKIPLRKSFGDIWSLYYRPVMRAVREIKPDVLYVRGGKSWAAMTAMYAKEKGLKSIWHVASSADITPTPIFTQIIRPFDIIERKSIQYAIRNSTYVVAQAKFQSDVLMESYGRHSEIIHQGLPEHQGNQNKAKPITVVWVANIKKLKQPEEFIRLAKAFKQDDRVRFIMIGRPSGGEYQRFLDSSIEALPNLVYLGEIPVQAVDDLLSKAHIFVNTSIYEGFSNTFVQAWMQKVPVISLLLDPDNILTREKIGFCSGSFEQLVRDVHTLIDNPVLLDDMGRRAQEYAMKHHSLKKNMGRLLELIQS